MGGSTIDPKGVVGELEYEVGAMIRNPIEQPDLYAQPEVVERRLQILTATLNLDYHRALAMVICPSRVISNLGH